MDAAEWDRRYSTSELVWRAEPNRILVEETNGLRLGRALDLGAGEGRNAVWLATQGWQVVAVDFSAVGLRKAGDLGSRAGVEIDRRGGRRRRRAAGPGLRPGRRAVPAPSAPAAAVGPPQRGGCPRRRRDPAGRRPRHHQPDRRVGGPQDPSVLFDPDDVTADLDGTGVEIVRAERVLRPVPADDGQRTAIDALVRAMRPT